MATKIKHKRSSVSGNAPTTSQIDQAEFAFNTADGSIFIKDDADNIIETTSKIYKNTTNSSVAVESPVFYLGGAYRTTQLVSNINDETAAFLPDAYTGYRINTDYYISGIVTSITNNIIGPASLTESQTPTEGSFFNPNDDGFWQLTLPFSITYDGDTYTTIYVSTNSYITFGAGSTLYSGIGADRPGLPKIMIASGDRSCQRIYYGEEGTAPNRTYRVRFEGSVDPSGILGSPTIEWEVTFYEAAGWQSTFDVQIGIQQVTPVIADPVVNTTLNGQVYVENKTDGTYFASDVIIKDSNHLRLLEESSNGTNHVQIRAASSVPSDYTLQLPSSVGTVGQTLSLSDSDGSYGILQFTDPDVFGGNRVYVSASKGNDDNDGIHLPVLTLKRACQIASGMVYTSGGLVNGQRVNVVVAAGDYTEQNPIIIPDNVTVKGDSLRSVVIRPANANQDMLRVRNGCYFGEFTFRDGLSGNTPTYTWNYAVSFDDPLDTTVDRNDYVYLPTTKPLITQSPYVQNCSIISFLGGNGCLVDGSKVVTPNTSANQIEAENPVSGPAPDQGKSMVANAFTMLSFGGTGWRLINDAYAQIVSCFQIFMLNGVYTQSGGYCSITNSATNFGLYALRASGYSPNAFAFDKGYIGTTGTTGSTQTITAFGWTRVDGPINEFVIRIYDPITTADLTSTYKTTLPGYLATSFNAATAVDTATNIFTISSHGFLNGDTVTYDSNGGTDISPLFSGDTVYIGYLSSSTFKVYYDNSLTREIDIISVGAGTQYFRKQDYEMYVDELTETHNQFQTLTLDAGSSSGYSFTIGDLIEGTTGANPNKAYVYSYDSGTKQLVVCVNKVTVGLTETRSNFTTASQITSVAGVAASYFMTSGVVSRTDLYGADFQIKSTVVSGALTDVATLPGKQIWFHRPSVTNSSGHTWEYAGSGTDYNALPQNGGKGVAAYEQVSENTGKVYTSGTNELGDFKVGNFITAYNRTGNVTFTNKITVDTLDVLRLGVGGVTVESISIDPELGLNETGGPKDTRISTQLAVYSYNQIHLGNVIDKNVSTNAVPGSLVQLNSNGQINSDLIPTSRSFSSFSSAGVNSRLDLADGIPAGDVLSGDIAVEAFYQQELTLDNPITAAIGTAVIQTTGNTATTSITSTTNSFTVTHTGTLSNSTYVLIEGVTPTAYNGVWLINKASSGSFTVFTNINPGTATVQGTIYYGGASGRLKGSYTAATAIIVGSVFTNFNTAFVTGASTLIIGTDRTPSDTNTAVTVSIAGTASSASLNYFLNVGTYSQYLVLENTATPTFTNGSISKAFRYSNVGYVTTSLAHNFATGNEVKVNASTDSFDGTDYITVISSTEFSYSSSGTDTSASATTTATATLVGVTGTSTTGSVASASLTGTITVGDYVFGATLPYGAKVTVVNMAVNPRTFTIDWPTSSTVTGTSTATLTFVTPASETGTVRSVLTAADSASQGEFTELRSGVLTSVNNLSGLTGGSGYTAGIYSRVPLTNQTVATTSISSTATVATITHGTTSINTFVTGSQVVIAGTTASSGSAGQYNGTWTVTTGSSGSFTITGTFTNGATASVQGTVASGVGECALAAITVSGAGAVTDVDLVFGGANYAVGSTLTTSNAYLGGAGSGFKITTAAIEKRAYVNLFGGQTFIATAGAPDFVEENASTVLTVTATSTVVGTFNAQSTGSGGGVDTLLNRITTLAPHGFSTGDPVLYNPGSDPAVGGLTSGNIYYVKVISSTTIELYTNYGISTIIVLSTSTGTGHTFTRKTVDIVDNTLTIPSHGFSTGDAFRINGSDLPSISSIQITSGSHYFVGAVTTNSFTVHELRSDALDSISGVTINPVNITATGSGTITITKNNIKITSTVNTSSSNFDDWNSLTTSTIDASSVISGILSTSRLASGSASSSTFLRGDSTWSPVVQSATLAASSALTLTGTGVGPYTGALTFDVTKVNKTGGSGDYSTTGVASFNITQFSVGTGDSLSAGQVLIKAGVIDAGTLDTYDSTYFLNPSNLTSAVPVNKGGTALVTYTTGDTLYASGSTTINTLAIGVADTVMTSAGSAPQWSPALTIAKNISISAADVTTSSTSASTVFNTNSTALKLGGAANNVNIGSSTDSQSLSSTVKSYTTGGSASTTVTVNVGLTATISTVARATNTSTITTSANHGLTTGDVVTVVCTSDTAFSAIAVSVTVTGLTTFTYSNSGTNTGSTGGTGSVYIGATGIALGTTASNGDTSLIFVSTTGVRVGMLVQGSSNFAAGTTVTGVNATRVYLSAATTGGVASGVAIIFTDTNTSLGISTGDQITIASSTVSNLDGTWPVTSAGATSTTFGVKVITAVTATNATRAGTIVRINNLLLKNRTVTLGSSEASATPVAATLKGENAVGTNTAGAALTIRPGLSTGTGTGAVINFQTGTTGSSGDTTQSAITRMALTQSAADTTLDLTTAMTTANVFNTTATTVNAFGAATNISMGTGAGTFTIGNALTVISSTKSIQIPVGTTLERPSAVTGQIRFNSTLSTFEGYGASGWGSLGGVKSVDGFTYIIPETSPGASNGELEFYVEDAAGTGTVKAAGLTRIKLAVLPTTASTTSTTGALTVAGGVGVTGNVYVGSGSKVGFVNASDVSVVYQYYNSATNSLDTIFG